MNLSKGEGEEMKVSYKGFTAEEWADRFDEQRQTLCAVQDTLDGVNGELRAAKLQIEEARKAWETVKDWVGCDDRSAAEAQKEIAEQVAAMDRALAIKPKCRCGSHDHGSCIPACDCGGVIEKR